MAKLNRCTSKTAQGLRCKNYKKQGHDVCGVHYNMQTKYELCLDLLFDSVENIVKDVEYEDVEQDEVQSPEEIELMFKSFEEQGDSWVCDGSDYDEHDVVPEQPPISEGYALLKYNNKTRIVEVLQIKQNYIKANQQGAIKNFSINKIQSYIPCM